MYKILMHNFFRYNSKIDYHFVRVEFRIFVKQTTTMSQFYSVTIKNIIKETTDAVSILFDIPQNIQKDFKFIAGQYVTLKATINGEEVRRAYSLCSSPNSNKVKVAVKAVENGKFSTFATKQLQVGDTLEVSSPEGKFTLQPQSNKNYIAFAAGSGITPILSMIQSVLEKDNTSTFTLIYGNKSIADTMFFKSLNLLKEKYSQQFYLHYIFSREQQDNALFGRIDRGHTNYFIKNIYKETTFDEAFLCGPEEMIDLVSGTLIENGFTSEKVHFELFTASIDENAVEEIKDGETEVKVILDDEEISFTMQQNDTILAASLRNKVDAPYSCQGGVCSSCIGKITEGKAVMTKNQILTDSEIEEGLVLTCQAHPTTATIVVDFDDV